MKIFLDTADVAAIEKWKSTGLIDGITTNPTHLSKYSTNPVQTIKKICSLLPEGSISVEVTESEPEAVYKQAHAIAKLAKNVVVKIPCHFQYYEIIKRLVNENIKINVTLLFTLIQGLYMCKLGVYYISPFLGRWDDIDQEGTDLIYELREMIDQYQYETQLLAASFRTVRHLHHAILAGADIATLGVELFEKSLKHPLTDKGMDQFSRDWKKLGITQFP